MHSWDDSIQSVKLIQSVKFAVPSILVDMSLFGQTKAKQRRLGVAGVDYQVFERDEKIVVRNLRSESIDIQLVLNNP